MVSQIIARRREKVEAPKESALDQIMKGLAGVRMITGIVSDVQGIQRGATQQEAADVQLEALKAPKVEEEPGLQQVLAGGKFQPKPEGFTGPVTQVQTKGGLVDLITTDQQKRFFERQTAGERQAFEKEKFAFEKGQKIEDKKIATNLRKIQNDEKKAEKEIAKLALGNKSVDQMRSEWAKSDITKATNVIVPAFDKINTSIEQGSAAGDLAAIFAFMKLLDPTSTVREGEFANAQNAKGVDGVVVGWYNKAREGTRLTKKQRADFTKTAQNMLKAQLSSQHRLDASLAKVANERGLDPTQVVLDLGQGGPTLDLFKQGQEDAAIAVEADESQLFSSQKQRRIQEAPPSVAGGGILAGTSPTMGASIQVPDVSQDVKDFAASEGITPEQALRILRARGDVK